MGKKHGKLRTKFCATMKLLQTDQFQRIDITHFVLAGFVFLCFYPVLSCWYYGDDTVSRDIHALMWHEQKNLGEFITNQMTYYILKMGRFYPAHIVQRFLTFYFLNTITKYRIYILAMNTLALFTFSVMVKRFSGSRKLFYAVLLLFPGVFFFLTRYDDALTSYFMFVQTLVIYLSISLIFLKKYMDTGRKRWICWSVFLYLLSLLTYEVSYLLVWVYPLAFFCLCKAPVKKKLKKAALSSIPYFSVLVSCFCTYVYFSVNAVSDYEGIHFSPDVHKIILTFLKQLAASFPVVPHGYLVFHNGVGFFHDVYYTLMRITVTDIISAFIFSSLLVIFFTRWNDSQSGFDGNYFLVFFSILLILCPGIVIALSRKYQQSLVWGQGYLTVYMTRFGILLLGLCLYEMMIRRIQGRLNKTCCNTALILLLVAVHLFSLQGNRIVLQTKNQTSYLRLVAEQSIEHGLLKNIPDNATILLGNIWYDYPSFTRNSLFSRFCNAFVTTDTIQNFITLSWQNHLEPKNYRYDGQNVYYYHFNKYLSNTGYAFIGKLDSLSVDKTGITNLYATAFKFFYSGEECEAVDIRVKEGDRFVTRRLPLIRSGYKTYTAKFSGLADLQSIELVQRVKPSLWQP